MPDPPATRPSGPGVRVLSDLGIPLADGTQLSGDLYLPEGHAPGPVLVSYYPYRTDDIIGSLFEHTRIGLARRGYPTLFVDMAGTGASEGSYGESFDLPREGRDCAEVIEWAARQDWCDGTVGAWGVSYGGMTALAAAAARPPHLRAIAAVYATTDMYRDTIAPGGSPAMLGRYAWAAHMVALGLCPPTRQDPGGRWERIWRQRLRRLATGQPHALAWQAHPDRDDYWQARVVDASAIDVPAMLIGGWTDAYADAILRVHAQVGGPKRLIMGPVDARAAASVPVPALRLGRRHGGLVGHPPAARSAPPRAGPAGAVLHRRRRLAGRTCVATRRSVQQAVLPRRASPRGESARYPRAA